MTYCTGIWSVRTNTSGVVDKVHGLHEVLTRRNETGGRMAMAMAAREVSIARMKALQVDWNLEAAVIGGSLDKKRRVPKLKLCRPK